MNWPLILVSELTRASLSDADFKHALAVLRSIISLEVSFAQGDCLLKRVFRVYHGGNQTEFISIELVITIDHLLSRKLRLISSMVNS